MHQSTFLQLNITSQTSFITAAHASIYHFALVEAMPYRIITLLIKEYNYTGGENIPKL